MFADCPLITCPGKTFASRVSGSILTTLGMPEMICNDIKEYENRIIELASDPDKLKNVRQKLLLRKKESHFFDNKYYANEFGKMCLSLLDTYKQNIKKDENK